MSKRKNRICDRYLRFSFNKTRKILLELYKEHLSRNEATLKKSLGEPVVNLFIRRGVLCQESEKCKSNYILNKKTRLVLEGILRIDIKFESMGGNIYTVTLNERHTFGTLVLSDKVNKNDIEAIIKDAIKPFIGKPLTSRLLSDIAEKIKALLEEKEVVFTVNQTIEI